MSGNIQAETQKEAFGQLVEDGTWGDEFDHPPQMKAFFTSVIEEALSLVDVSGTSPSTALDAGCGNGAWLDCFADTFVAGSRAGMRLFGFDITPEMVDAAGRRLSGKPGEAQLRPGDALAPDSFRFGDQDTFDLVYSFDVIQQLPRRRQMEGVETMLASVRPGGVLVIFDHDSQSAYGRKMGFKKFVTARFGIELVPKYYCNAQYPPLGRFASALDKRANLNATIRLQPDDGPKQALLVQKLATNGA